MLLLLQLSVCWFVCVCVCVCEDECSEHVCDGVDCYNGGSCVATGPDSSVCLCPLGTAGPRCQSSEFLHSQTDEQTLLWQKTFSENVVLEIFVITDSFKWCLE